MTVRTDATRLRITPADPRPLRAVAPRQGQVLLDADFDQDGRLTLARVDGDMADVIGAPGRFAYPSSTSAFAITLGGGPLGLQIGAGHGFLDGWRLDNPTVCTLATQPHPRTTDVPVLPMVLAVKALIRHIDPVEEPQFADRALGDAQASGRLIADWQVLPQAMTGPVTCATVLTHADWLRLSAPSNGTLAVLVQPSGPGSDPCSLSPQGGYTRLENLLYRLEVHGGVPASEAGNPPALADGPRFGLQGLKLKLSRHNASLLVAITSINGNEITVSPPALDPRAWFAPGAYAEIVSPHDDLDPRAALANERLFRVSFATDDRVTLDAAVGAIAATGASAAGGWFLRLWDAVPDGTGLIVLGVPNGNGVTAEQSLGDGLSVQGGGGAAALFRRGDFWTFAARADGTIDWPATPQQPPQGPETRYAPLAIASGIVAAPTLEECRIPFARLVDRVLHYRGGDGQSAFAGAAGGPVTLDAPLRLQVMRGSTPVAGALVQWSRPPGARSSQIDGGPVTGTQTTTSTTDAQGQIAATWRVDGSAPGARHQVQASLVGDGGAQPVTFTARFDEARTTSYEPHCVNLVGTDNVQDALDTLCGLIGDSPSLILDSIDLIDAKDKVTPLIKEELILNGAEVGFDAFLKGIAIGIRLTTPLELGIAPFDPILEVELDLPYPTTDPDKAYWLLASQAQGKSPLTSPFGFQRLRLDGKIETGESPTRNEPALIWSLAPTARDFLTSSPLHGFGFNTTTMHAEILKNLGWRPTPVDRILCRLRLRSAHVWADAKDEKTGKEHRLYLNAEHLGVKGPDTGRELRLHDRDPQRAADLDIFFYLMPRL